MSDIIVRAPNWVGDAVMCTPALAALRQKYPGKCISLLAVDRVVDCFLNNPSVNEITPLPGRKRLSYWSKALEFRRKKYDMAVLFPNSFSSALLFRISGASRICGYCRDGRGFMLTNGVEVTEKLLKSHHAEYYFHLIKSLPYLKDKPADTRPGGKGKSENALIAETNGDPANPVWVVTDKERKEAEEILQKNRIIPENPLIGVSPGATFGPAKKWPPERFGEVADKLVRKYSAEVLVFGKDADTETVSAVCNKIKAGNALNLAGKTNLRQLGALLSMCRIFLTNDSGAMHIASAVKIPVIAIFGSTDPWRTGPLGNGHRVIYKKLDCSPCFKRKCPRGDYRCLHKIKVEDVFAAAEELLKDG